MGAKEAGQAFIAGVLAKLPEADRAAAQAVLEKSEAALVAIGDGVLARSEFSKQMDDLKTKQAELDNLRTANQDWYTKNKGALEDYVKIKPDYDKLVAGGDPPLPPAGVTQEEINKAIAASLNERDRYIAGALGMSMDLSARHLHMFQEPLNTTELLSDPKLGTQVNGQTYGLMDAYNAKHGERVKTHVDAVEAARIKKLVDEGVKAEMAKLPRNQEHPFPLRDPSPSPLDALTAERKPSDHTVDSAVLEYERLQAARAGSTA